MREEICLLLEYELLGCVSTCLSCFIYKLHTHISHGTKKKNYIGSPQDFDNSFFNKSHVNPLGCRTMKD